MTNDSTGPFREVGTEEAISLASEGLSLYTHLTLPTKA